MRSDARRKYRDNCRRFIIPKLGDTLLISLELEDIQLAVNQVWQDVSGPTARSVGESIKTILYWGDEQEWTVRPRLLRLLPKLLLPPKPVRQLPPQEKMIELIRPCLAIVYGPRTGKLTRRGYLYRRIMWTIFIVNGLRRGELTVIDMADIDWATGTAAITKGYDRLDGEILEGGTKTRNSLRTLWLPQQALEAIAYKARLWPGEKLLFEPKDGANVYGGMYSNYLRKVCTEAGLSKENTKGVIHFHGLRHEFATLAEAAGVPRTEIGAAMGHSRVERGGNATSGYIHATAGGRDASEAVERAFALLLPARITPLEEALTLAQTGYQRLSPAEQRQYHLEYRQKRRLALPSPADNTRTKSD